MTRKEAVTAALEAAWGNLDNGRRLTWADIAQTTMDADDEWKAVKRVCPNCKCGHPQDVDVCWVCCTSLLSVVPS